MCRRYGTTLRNTCFALFKEVLENWKLTPYVKIRETDFSIVFPSGSEIIMVGLDEETKLLSLTNIGAVFIEEVYEVSKDMVEQLNLRLRGVVKNQQILMALNPISSSSWLYDFLEVNPPESFILIKSTYRDNPFLNEEYVKSLEELLVRNPLRARIYTEGLWGVADPEGLVFSNWEIKEFDPLEIAKLPKVEHRCGLDFGWVDATAIADSLYDPVHSTIYVINECYSTGMTLDDIANAVDIMGLKKAKLYCDSAEPRGIEFLRSKGINAYPCIKGANMSRWDDELRKFRRFHN